MGLLKFSVGIDVDSKKLKCCFGSIDMKQAHKVQATRAFENNVEGFKALDTWIRKHWKDRSVSIVVTMEVTGVYHEQVANHLHEKGYVVSIVLANRAKKYMQSLGYKSKTDKIDAKGLSQMGAEQCLTPWKPIAKEILGLRSLTRHREALNEALTAFRNQQHAQEFMQHSSAKVMSSQAKVIKTLKEQIAKIDAEILDLAKQDTEFYNKVMLIVNSVKGLGLLTVVTVAVETNQFELFMNTRQLTSYAGYDIVENQSSDRVGKTKISKHGNAHIRRALYMPALNVVRWEVGRFKKTYDRIFQRSFIPMKAYVAIQRKLLCLIYTLWKKNEAFNPKYVHQSLVLSKKHDEQLVLQS
jgi:transposase